MSGFVQSQFDAYKFRWHSAREGRVLVIIVYYTKGGMISYSDREVSRGIYVQVGEVDRQVNGNVAVEKAAGHTHPWFLVKSLKKASRKEMDVVMSALLPHCADLALLWQTEGRDATVAKMREILFGALS